MGDLSEMRGLIIIGSVIGVFILLYGWMPSQLVYPESGMTNLNIPQYFEGQSTVLYNNTFYSINFTLDAISYPAWWGYWGQKFTFADSKYLFGYWNTTNYSGHTPEFICDVIDAYDIYVATCSFSTKTTDYGTALSYTELDALKASGGDLQFSVTCSGYASFTIMLAYDEDVYSTPTQAFQADAMKIQVGQTIDQIGTATSATGILWNVLTFQWLSVNPYLAALLAIPFWIATAYLIFIVVLRMAGAIFGGGGA
jgi:hypothetical protein